MANLRNVQFVRNQSQTEFTTKEQAIAKLRSLPYSLTDDGTIVFARYKETGVDSATTVAGLVSVRNDGTSSYQSVTILDSKAMDDILALLGPGITSANTATMQLEALSGNTFTAGTSSSADTSVEGAKAYAYDLVQTLDNASGDTELGKVVVGVTETDGIINVKKALISASGNTLVKTTDADGTINFDVNIDNATIVQDPTGKLKVADSALTQNYGDEKTIHADFDATNNKKTFSSLVYVKKITTGIPETVKERYQLVDADGNPYTTASGNTSADIDIPKDSALVNFYLGHVDDKLTDEDPATHESPTTAITSGSGDTALVWVMQLANGNYKLTAVDVHSFIDEAEFDSGVTWDSAAKKVRADIDTNSEKDSQGTPVDFLVVTADGIKVQGIKDEIDRRVSGVVSGLDSTVEAITSAKTGTSTSGHVHIKIEEVDGKLSGITFEEIDIAGLDKLNELSAKTVSEISSSNSSISAVSATNTDGTVKYDIVTDASKIKMSGFTSTDIFSAITPSSSITEAVGEIERVVSGIAEAAKVDIIYDNTAGNVGSGMTITKNAQPSGTTFTIQLGTLDCGTY